MLPRLQLFEFNDAPFVPESLQRTLISTLSRMIRWGHLLDRLAEPFAEFLAAARTNEVLDIASGAGEPASVLIDALEERGHRAPTFTLTDLLPHPELWREVEARHPEKIAFVPEPVDALSIEPSLGRGRARVMINAFHHFPPELAQQILVGMAKDAPGVFIAESLVRNPFSFASMAPWGVAALLAEPVLGAGPRLSTATYAWLTPIALLASGWDGTVSTLRCYSEDELRGFARAIPGWRWSFGEYRVGKWGKGTWFWGVPSSS